MKKTSSPDESTTPSSNQPFRFPTAGNPAEPAGPVPPVTEAPTEEAIDHGIEESFPASDPVSVSVTKVDAGKAATGVEKVVKQTAKTDHELNEGTADVAHESRASGDQGTQPPASTAPSHRRRAESGG